MAVRTASSDEFSPTALDLAARNDYSAPLSSFSNSSVNMPVSWSQSIKYLFIGIFPPVSVGGKRVGRIARILSCLCDRLF